MNIKNKKRANRFLTILFTLLFAASVFTVTAFATGASSSETTTTTTGTPSQTQPVDVPSDVSSAGSASQDGTGSVTPESDSSAVNSVVSSQASSAASSSAPASSRRETVSSKKPVEIPKHVDTQESRVEQIASQADAAVSDPDVLSSENWSELLSSGSQSSAPSSANSDAGLSSATSSKASQGGGISWLLILGIVLIMLAICGIVFFVYEQFLKGHDDDFGGPSGPSGPNDISSHSSGDSSQTDTSPTEFTDISSDSDGVQHREGYVPAGKQSPVSTPPAVSDAPSAPPTDSVPASPAAPEAKVQKTVNLKSRKPNDGDITAPIPQVELPVREPSIPEPETQSLPKAQATPLENGKNFDWEEFFNGNDK
jgi:hypothetical protein